MFPGMGGSSFPSTSMMFQYYASFTGLMMMITTAINTYVPDQVRIYIVKFFRNIFYGRKNAPNTMTVAIKEFQGGSGGVHNQVFEAAETYLNTKISPTMKGLEFSKSAKDKKVNISVNKRSQYIEDEFEGVKLSWRMVGGNSNSSSSSNNRMIRPPIMHRPGYSDAFFQDPSESNEESPTRFELIFDEKHYEKVVESYIPYILKKAKELNDANTTLKLWSSGGSDPYSGRGPGGVGGGVNLQHPSTFQTLALDPELKKDIIDDLDRFVRRRDFYTKVGKAWKRGYLLYGPPGTGKSSLVAAMANYLNFDVYDLELTNIRSNSQLRSVLLGTKNRSILLIEDIDCSAEMRDRSKTEDQFDEYGRPYRAKQGRNPDLTLSGLLNFIDGIWSSCGDERIIVFTTNHKDKLDPALLRPGRMDKHIHMSYITAPGFRILASNYLSVEEHHLFGEIEELLQASQTTPAEVAEELMVSDDANVSLTGLVQFLKRKIVEAKQLKEEEAQKALEKALEEEKDQKETKDEEPKKTRKTGMCSKCGSMKPPPGVFPFALEY
ncbi:hypothetical protein MKW92_032773 [Papaver armeniacum]|nr:hypothetical protein MKW92_032773 [Papaver armeniacum]